MRPAEPLAPAAWRAELALEFERRGPRTVLAGRRHDGPLVVQKPLYPEGDAVCHAIVVHPPAGVAAGDELTLDAALGPAAHALLTTPGAGKWYRSSGAHASQRLAFAAGAGACLEWLPQETIVFDGARADLECEVGLAGDARYIGWEIVCLGRTGSGERFARGSLRTRTAVRRDGRLLWLERACIDGDGALLRSPAALAGEPVYGTFLAAAPEIGRDLVAACREAMPAFGDGAVTALPGVLVGRYLGPSGEAARRYFARLWGVLRPAVAGRAAVAPRIWHT